MFRIADPELLASCNRYREELAEIISANLANLRKMKLPELLELSESKHISQQLRGFLAEEIRRRLSLE